jgi:hypothetical protein
MTIMSGFINDDNGELENNVVNMAQWCRDRNDLEARAVSDEDAAAELLKHTEQRNAANRRRLANERHKNNTGVIRSYRLKS